MNIPWCVQQPQQQTPMLDFLSNLDPNIAALCLTAGFIVLTVCAAGCLISYWKKH